MWGQIVDTHELCIFTNDPPDGLLAEAVSPYSARPADATKDDTSGDIGNVDPCVNCYLHPGWDRNSPHVSSLPKEVDDRRVIVSLLKVVYGEPSEFGST